MWMTFVLVLPHGVSIPTRNVGEQYRHVRPVEKVAVAQCLAGGGFRIAWARQIRACTSGTFEATSRRSVILDILREYWHVLEVEPADTVFPCSSDPLFTTPSTQDVPLLYRAVFCRHRWMTTKTRTSKGCTLLEMRATRRWVPACPIIKSFLVP